MDTVLPTCVLFTRIHILCLCLPGCTISEIGESSGRSPNLSIFKETGREALWSTDGAGRQAGQPQPLLGKYIFFLVLKMPFWVRMQAVQLESRSFLRMIFPGGVKGLESRTPFPVYLGWQT